MALRDSIQALALPLLVLLLCTASSSSFSSYVSVQQQGQSGLSWRTARSLTSSLLHRIANHRVAKGDVSGAERINQIASTVDSTFYFWKSTGSIGWDYLIHYSWRSLNPSQIFEMLRVITDIQSAVAEFLQLRTDAEHVRWMSTNYSRILQLAKSSLQKLLRLVDQPGALRNFVLSVQTEIVSGDILRDALQLGAADVHSLVQVAKDLFLRYYGPSYTTHSSSEL